MIKKYKSYIQTSLRYQSFQKLEKKLRILLSIFLANVTVLTDLLIIVVFSRILGKDLTSENVIVDFVLNNKYLLPIIIIFRFIAIYIEKTNIQLLVLQIMQNLKDYIIREVYKKGNFSVADATFYTGTFSIHMSIFTVLLPLFKQYNSVNNLFNLFIHLDLRTVCFIIGGLFLIPTKYLLELVKVYS